MRVLISGAGIAGSTLAYWLAHYGFEVTLIEVAPRLRTGGYIIDFWGAGFEIAEGMGLVPELRNKGYLVRELRVLNRNGKRVAGFPVAPFARITRGRLISLPRGELAASIFHQIENRVEIIFGDSITRIAQTADGVRVTFVHGNPRDFDLVIGADGLHSRVRELIFGPEVLFEKYLHCKAAAFESAGYRPRDELIYVMYTQVGQQVARFAMSGDRTLFFFTFADDDPAIPSQVSAQKSLLTQRFGKSGWECPQILEALHAAGDDLYFDRVSQIEMGPEDKSWTRGRVTLLGDAAFCISLLGGQGSALAMVAAYILAGELYRAKGDHAAAFRHYEDIFSPFVRRKQKAALGFAGTFAPKSRLALFMRNGIFNLLALPFAAHLASRNFTDEIALPDYT